MSGQTATTLMCPAPKKHVSKMRVHDYLYDSAFIVSGARDYARTSFKAAMQSAQVVIQPVFNTMFSEIRKFPRCRIVYHPNCRLPEHVDRSYGAYLARVQHQRVPVSVVPGGRDRFKFLSSPKKVLEVKSTTPDFHPTSPVFLPSAASKSRNKGTQSLYRESSAQTVPWQPDGKANSECENTPEVLHLDKLEWGPGDPYRTGDLPADFHTTEIINKMRHARTWTALVEGARLPSWMKRNDGIITDLETNDWIFREAEIDELQDIRLQLLHKLQHQQRQKQCSRTSTKLAKRWATKKEEMQKKIDYIRKSRDREIRKLTFLHESGGKLGLVQRTRASRGGGAALLAAVDPTSDLHAPVARHGYQARRRHNTITYDPSLLSMEDHAKISEPPAWLEQCARDLVKSCSGHILPQDPQQLCQRETKWSEDFLEKLHNDLKKARLGAGNTAGPLRLLKPRRLQDTPRPATPQVEQVYDEDENCHQMALLLQRIIRGRAVQTLVYEGRTRASELTEELKTTHGLQREDKLRINREEAKARDYNAHQIEEDLKEDAINALVDELCGGAVSAALDFLEKELRRLREERRQHAFILIALREKTMREAAEAGRRQKEEHRRREHDEMFKQILGITQETVDSYFREIIHQSAELAAEEDAQAHAVALADKYDALIAQSESMSTAEQNELVGNLVSHCLLPEAHKLAARQAVADSQRAALSAAREAIFGLLDDAEVKADTFCAQCGSMLDDTCRCRSCPGTQSPRATTARLDPRWKHTRRRDLSPKKTTMQRFPATYEARRLLDSIVDDVAVRARTERAGSRWVCAEFTNELEERALVAIEARQLVDLAVQWAVGESAPPVRDVTYHHYSKRVHPDAIERVTTPPIKSPPLLPSELRRREELAALEGHTSCHCEDGHVDAAVEHAPPDTLVTEEAGDEREELSPRMLLPSALRALEELRRCKCDSDRATPEPEAAAEYMTGDMTTTTLDTEDMLTSYTTTTTAAEEGDEDDAMP